MMPIGQHIIEEKDFRNHNIQVAKGDCFYIFSDGVPDQFGGKEGKKFLSRQMKSMFCEIHKHSMEKQKEMIDKILADWMEGFEQVDDMIIMGVRI
jgi:serine phosphatase RsbU (regulator of sigma subunit)